MAKLLSPREVAGFVFDAGFGKNHPLEVFVDAMRLAFSVSHVKAADGSPQRFEATSVGYVVVGSGLESVGHGHLCCDAALEQSIGGANYFGLFRIGERHVTKKEVTKAALLDPAQNAAFAYKLYTADPRRFALWSDYANGTYREFHEVWPGIMWNWFDRKGRPFPVGPPA